VFFVFVSELPKKALPQLRQLVADCPPWWPGFELRSDDVGFVVDKVALGQVSFE
jgi:hypothetical protein